MLFYKGIHVWQYEGRIVLFRRGRILAKGFSPWLSIEERRNAVDALLEKEASV